jgi:2'-5' RNA ligase
MSEKLRVFVAVKFSEQVVDALARLIERLRGKPGLDSQLKWVAAHNLHMTLQFLGDLNAGLVPKLAGSLGGGYADLKPFEVELGGVGAFPASNRARVLWAGIQRGADGLKALHTATCAVTEGFGFVPEDRPFSAHVTLGRTRARGRKLPDLSQGLDGLAGVELGKCQIGEVHLVKSDLRSSGPVYTTLDSFPVGG